MSTQVSPIPPELIDAIVGCLNSPRGTKTLKSCCLVSRTWFAITRRYLFDRLCLASKEEMWTGWKGWNGFLVQPHPDISFVTTLYVDGPNRPVQLTYEQLSPNLSSLPRLRLLSIQGWGHYGFYTKQSEPLIISLDELRIGDLLFARSPQDTLDILRSISPARAVDVYCSIHIPGYTWGAYEQGLMDSLELPSSDFLESLSVRDTDAVKTLSSFKIGLDEVAPIIPCLCTFLRSLRNLKELTVDLWRITTAEQASSQACDAVKNQLGPALSTLRTLQKVSLCLDSSTEEAPLWEFVLTLLRALPTSLLFVDFAIYSKSFPMQSLETHLLRITALKKARILLDEETVQEWPEGEMDDYGAEIRREMPTLAARGLLEIAFETGRF